MPKQHTSLVGQAAALEHDATIVGPGGHFPAGAHVRPAPPRPTQQLFVVRSQGVVPHVVEFIVTGATGCPGAGRPVPAPPPLAPEAAPEALTEPEPAAPGVSTGTGTSAPLPVAF